MRFRPPSESFRNHNSAIFPLIPFPSLQANHFSQSKGFLSPSRSASNMEVPNTQPLQQQQQLPKQGINIGVEAAGENNVLAKHVAFFDMNNDGVVYPWETFKGFRAIGCGLPLSTFAALFINMGLSQKTRPGKFPSLRFPIEIKNIAKAKHGSDSGVYDTEGRFVPAKFEEIFKKHAHTTPDALTGDELQELLKANREPKDFGGWLAGYTEWKILYVLCKDKDGLLHKDTVRGVYDGSLFERMASEKASAHKKA